MSLVLGVLLQCYNGGQLYCLPRLHDSKRHGHVRPIGLPWCSWKRLFKAICPAELAGEMLDRVWQHHAQQPRASQHCCTVGDRGMKAGPKLVPLMVAGHRSCVGRLRHASLLRGAKVLDEQLPQLGQQHTLLAGNALLKLLCQDLAVLPDGAPQ